MFHFGAPETLQILLHKTNCTTILFPCKTKCWILRKLCVNLSMSIMLNTLYCNFIKIFPLVSSIETSVAKTTVEDKVSKATGSSTKGKRSGQTETIVATPFL